MFLPFFMFFIFSFSFIFFVFFFFFIFFVFMTIPFHSMDVFSGIVECSWKAPWQARKTNGEGGCGHVKNNTLTEMRKSLGARLCRKSLNFRYVPKSRITRVVQNPRHASTMKQVSDGSTESFWESTRCVVVAVKSLLRHISGGDVLSNPGENKGLCHVIPGTKLCVEHTATQTLLICRIRQEARSTEHINHNTFQSCVCEPPDLQLLCQQYLGTLRECFQFVSELARGLADDCCCRILNAVH